MARIAHESSGSSRSAPDIGAQQLSRLREAGLVVDRREGLNVFYSLVDESIVRLLEITRQSAMDLASFNGVKLAFRQLEHDESCPCTCPNCGAPDEAPAG